MSTHDRPTRVAHEFQRELSAVLARGLKDPRVTGFVTVTGAKMGPDLKDITVYVSVQVPGKTSVAVNEPPGQNALLGPLSALVLYDVPSDSGSTPSWSSLAIGGGARVNKHLSASVAWNTGSVIDGGVVGRLRTAVPGLDVCVPAFNLSTLLATAPKILLNYQSDDYHQEKIKMNLLDKVTDSFYF